MRDEIATTMRLLGVTKLDQLGPHLVCPSSSRLVQPILAPISLSMPVWTPESAVFVPSTMSTSIPMKSISFELIYNSRPDRSSYYDSIKLETD